MAEARPYSLASWPGRGDVKGLGQYLFELFEFCRQAKSDLNLENRWLQNYRLYRGKHWQYPTSDTITLNLFGANVLRTVANLNARDPFPETCRTEGNWISDADRKLYGMQVTDLMTQLLKVWWDRDEHRNKCHATDLAREIYGVTIEKTLWDYAKGRPSTKIISPFAFYSWPDKTDALSDLPICFHAYPMMTAIARKELKNDDIQPDDVYEILGLERETYYPYTFFSGGTSTSNTGQPYQAPVLPGQSIGGAGHGDRTLMIEAWFHDYDHRDEYPDGVRRVLFCNEGRVILQDSNNPLINWELRRLKDGREKWLENSYLWGRYPFEFANSYEDDTNIWGFGQAEQVAVLVLKLDQILSRLVHHEQRAMYPIPMISRDSGISISDLTNAMGSYIEVDTVEQIRGVQYLNYPNLGLDRVPLINLLISVFDRVSQIEDADRGEAPKGIISGVAVRALQERGAVLMRQKIRGGNKLIKSRGEIFMSLLRNFQVDPITYAIDGKPIQFNPSEHLRDRLEITVQSGSELALGRVDAEARTVQMYQLLQLPKWWAIKHLDLPDADRLIEETAEDALGQAAQVFAQAGYPIQGGALAGVGEVVPLAPLVQALKLNQSEPPAPSGPPASEGAAGGMGPMQGLPQAEPTPPEAPTI